MAACRLDVGLAANVNVPCIVIPDGVTFTVDNPPADIAIEPAVPDVTDPVWIVMLPELPKALLYPDVMVIAPEATDEVSPDVLPVPSAILAELADPVVVNVVNSTGLDTPDDAMPPVRETLPPLLTAIFPGPVEL